MKTEFFFELTPDRVLDSVESSGLVPTGRCFTLNSFENRVYDVELEHADGSKERRVAKFYRPGRWTKAQILEEHEFLDELKKAEIPAIAPIAFSDGLTLHQSEASGGIYYSVFPKVGGRAPDELTDEQLIRIGRLLGRIHAVGASHPARHRLELSAATYGRSNLEFLLKTNQIPIEFSSRYRAAVEKICDYTDKLYKGVGLQRVHGDCHLGNLLWNQEGPFFLDFDDFVMAPAVQDIWMLVPGRDAEAIRARNVLLEGYSEMWRFDRPELRLIEPLRALRFVNYTAWVAKRWEDPAFPLAFPEFGSHRYWNDMTLDLEEQLRLIEAAF